MVSVFLQVVRLAEVQGVSEHELPEAPQCVRHGAVGALALQPVARQMALLFFGQVGVPPLCYWDDTHTHTHLETNILQHLSTATSYIYMEMKWHL